LFLANRQMDAAAALTLAMGAAGFAAEMNGGKGTGDMAQPGQGQETAEAHAGTTPLEESLARFSVSV
jgi:hypothetical protein